MTVVPVPSGLSGNSNDTTIEQDLNQWYQDSQQVGIDEQAIHTALQNMDLALQSDNPDAVFTAIMMFFTQIFPDVLAFQQDTMNALADSQNVASDLRNFVTTIQNDFNSGTTTSAAQGDEFYNNTNDLDIWANTLSNAYTVNGTTYWNSSNSPLDNTDGKTIQEQMGYDPEGASGSNYNQDGITGNFVQTNGQPQQVQTGWQWQQASNGTWSWQPVMQNVYWGPSASCPSTDLTVAQAIQYWNGKTNAPIIPSGQTPNPATPDPAAPANAIKGIQGNLQTSNSAVSTMATTVQTSEQFYTNQYNQLTGIDNSMQQNTVSEESSFVNNQKTS